MRSSHALSVSVTKSTFLARMIAWKHKQSLSCVDALKENEQENSTIKKYQIIISQIFL